ncbi:MAG: Unknown protein [uncultured Sulfurovum sp.]|uniref:Uncharacterized protein n=1 Tax=uncultured Sulfurovum sp. TaxID=269237 RepID=A0A6S6SWV5_9BACT|nr:MAG: Unknown protein [uncultured Sulfurovum sp.]
MGKLTNKEESFLKSFLEENDCGASTANDFLCDNFSCQNVEDLVEKLDVSAQVIGGFISSLEQKTIISIEERNNDCDLFWIEESFLEAIKDSGQGDVDFREINMELVA